MAIQNEEIIKKLSKMNANLVGLNIDPFYNAKDVIVVLVKKEDVEGIGSCILGYHNKEKEKT